MSAQIGNDRSDKSAIARLPDGKNGSDPARTIDAYSVRLFDYCQVILRSPGAAQGAWQAALDQANAQIGQLPAGDRAREWLYALARRECHRWRAGHAPDPAPAPLPARVLAGETAGHGSEGPLPGGGPVAAGDHPAADAYLAELRLSDLGPRSGGRKPPGCGTCWTDSPSATARSSIRVPARPDREGRGGHPHDLLAPLAPAARQGGQQFRAAVDHRHPDPPGLGGLPGARQGAGCDPEDTQAPLTPRLCCRVARHSRRCVVCGQIAANWAFGPESLGLLPLAAPPAALAGASAGLAAGYPVAAPPWI